MGYKPAPKPKGGGNAYAKHYPALMPEEQEAERRALIRRGMLYPEPGRSKIAEEEFAHQRELVNRYFENAGVTFEEATQAMARLGELSRGLRPRERGRLKLSPTLPPFEPVPEPPFEGELFEGFAECWRSLVEALEDFVDGLVALLPASWSEPPAPWDP